MFAARLVCTLMLAATAVHAGQERLTHRVWFGSQSPDVGTLALLQLGGVDQLAVEIGSAAIEGASVRFTPRPVTGAEAASGWPLAAVVWVEGRGDAKGDARSLLDQLSPALRTLPGTPRLVLAARAFWPGLPALARALSRIGGTVELAMPAVQLAEQVPAGGWKGVGLVAFVFGNPEALGLGAMTVHDDLQALETLDERGVEYRAALIVLPAVSPAVSGPASLAALARPEVAQYRPGSRGDVFTLKEPFEWGGVQLSAGATVEARQIDTATYYRDLSLLLEPVRPGLSGWDTVSLPAAEPAIGMSREAFFDFLRGGFPHPVPDVRLDRLRSGVYRLQVENRSPHSSAFASTGNWVEISFTGAELREVELGQFSGVQYGTFERGAWRDTIARDARAVRLLMSFVAPRARFSGAILSFGSDPRTLSARWGVRLGDGRDATGEPRAVTTR